MGEREGKKENGNRVKYGWGFRKVHKARRMNRNMQFLGLGGRETAF